MVAQEVANVGEVIVEEVGEDLEEEGTGMEVRFERSTMLCAWTLRRLWVKWLNLVGAILHYSSCPMA